MHWFLKISLFSAQTVSTVSLLLAVSGAELSSSKGPRARMQTAPSGAVMRMERTAKVSISPPIGSHSVLPILIQLSRKTGPRAADNQDYYLALSVSDI